MNIHIDFDYDKFQSVLLDAARVGFLDIQREHLGENFYMFGLSSSAEHGYINIGASTEEALSDLAAKYYGTEEGEENFYNHFTLEEMRSYFRFVDCYPELFSAIDEQFQKVTMPFTRLWQELIWRLLFERAQKGEITESEWEQVHDLHAEKFDSVCENVLRTLDAEGIFGKEQFRQKVYLTYVYGPEAGREVWYLGGIHLNPPEVRQRVDGQFAEYKRLRTIYQENQARYYLENRSK